MAELHDPRVAPRAVRHAGGDVREELVHGLLGAELAERLTAGVEVAAPAERDHLLGVGLHRFRLRLRGADAPVLDQRAREIRVQRLAMGRVAPELLPGPAVPHWSSSPPPPPLSPRRVSPCCCRVSLTSSIDFLPKLGIAASSF